MFFSKSFSDSAVDRAARWIRFLDNLEFLLTEVQEAEHQEALLQFYENAQLDMNDPKKIHAARCFVDFQNGIFLRVLEHIFDGAKSDFKKFEKEAILKAGNYGFGANVGKILYKDYLSVKEKYSEFKNSGMNWADEFYIPTVVDQELTIEDIQNYLENYGEDEDEEEWEGEEEEWEGEEEEWEGDNTRLIKLFSNAHLGDEKRYRIYKSYLESEIKKYPEIYKSEVLQKLEGITHKFGYEAKMEHKTDFKEVRHLINKYEFEERSPKRLFAAFELFSEIMGSQKIKSKLHFSVPKASEDSSNKLIYEPVKFFSLRDKILKTASFSFEFLDMDFPKFGKPYAMHSYPFRVPMMGNMYLFLDLTLILGEESYVFAKGCIPLSLGEFNEMQPDPDGFEEARSQQGFAINLGLRKWTKNPLGQRYQEAIEEYIKKAEETDEVFGRKTTPQIQKILKSTKNKSAQKQDEVLKKMSSFEFEISASTMEYFEPENLFTVATFASIDRRDHYNEFGSFFDPFECSVFEKVVELGMPINIKALKSGYSWLPNVVIEILVIERFFQAISGQKLDYDRDELLAAITPENLMHSYRFNS